MVLPQQRIQMRVETFAHAKEIADYWAILPMTLHDGFVIRYGIYLAAQPINGYVLILPDRDGFIESCSELAEDFANRGWQVWCMEWRGQGRTPQVMDEEDEPEEAILQLDEVGSELTPEDEFFESEEEAVQARRSTNTGATKIEVTDWYNKTVTDLEEFWIRAWLPETRGDPAIVLTQGHGSHIALKWLIKNKKRKLGKTSFIFSAPMVRSATAGLPPWLSYWLTALVNMFGAFPYPGQGRQIKANRKFETNLLTSDRVRFGVLQKWRELHPELAPRKYSYGHLSDAIHSGIMLQRNLTTGGYSWLKYQHLFWRKMWRERGEYLSQPGLFNKIRAYKRKKWRIDQAHKIKPPSLVMLTPDDRVVDAAAQYLLVNRFKKARLVQFKGAKHDIFQENDKIRNKAWNEIDRFIDKLYNKDHSTQQPASAPLKESKE